MRGVIWDEVECQAVVPGLVPEGACDLEATPMEDGEGA